MKKVVFGISLLLLIIGFSSCEKVKVSSDELLGRWEAQSQMPGAKSGDKFVLVFADNVCTMDDGNTYGKWGYQFDEGDGVHESDLEEHGNGWFGWSLQATTLYLINASDMHLPQNPQYPAKIVIKSFSGREMTIKDEYNTYTMRKVVK